MVQTPLGKGVVREVRKNGRLLIEIGGRSLVLQAHAVTPLGVHERAAGRRKTAIAPRFESVVPAHGPSAEVDLHGLTVEEALARAEQALNDALLADVSELRLIHGRSG